MNRTNRTEISTLGEFGLIEHLTSDITPVNAETLMGVGDDAAILSFKEGEEVLVTTDLLMEGVHFDLTYVPLQHLGYKATFPLLMNVDGQPTYFMSLKDNAGLVKMYAMVNVQNYNVVATGNSLPECQNNYSKLLRQEGLSQEAETGIDGVIDEIRTAVIDGNSWYYFRLIGEDWFYAVSAGQCETAVILDKGDKVTILGAAEEGQIRQAGSIVEN